MSEGNTFIDQMRGGNSFAAHIAEFIGKTVTIFTTSGGESGEGFTGVVISVNNNFVRLLVTIGPAPGCALGNACTDRITTNVSDITDDEDECTDHRRSSTDRRRTTRRRRRITNLGAVTDIPINRIAAFVHNAI